MAARKKILITGSLGFTGRHLADLLTLKSSVQLHCADHTPSAVLNTTFHQCDLSKANDTGKLIAAIRPDEIYHLVGSYTNEYDADYGSNVVTSKNVLDAVLRLRMKTRILLVGSSAEYGFPLNQSKAVTEDHPCKPVSVYGLAKLIQTNLSGAYIRLHGMDIVVVRPFNLLGSGMSERLFPGKMEQEIARYKRGEIKEIVTGDLSVRRDYIDIKEAIRYYSLVMEKGGTGEVYNVGSGKSISLRRLLAGVLSLHGLSLKSVKVKESPHKIPGKIVVPKIFADITKLRQLL